MTHLSLFSGIGGADLAAEWAGFETVAFVERDKFCQKVLKKHWPEVPIYDDVKTFSGESFRGVTVLSGGFPCQPFSIAGQRKGKEDSRALWPEMLRVVSESKPKWIIGENVLGLVSINDGMVFEEICASLENLNYEVQSFSIPACAINAPHRRMRIFIVANNTSNSSKQYRDDGHNNQRERSFIQSVSELRDGDRKGIIANAASGEALASKPGGLHSELSGANFDASNTEGGRRGFRIAENERKASAQKHPLGNANGLSAGWDANWIEVATALCGMDDGIPGRVDRLRALGNAIVPQQIYPIFQAITDIENGKIKD